MPVVDVIQELFPLLFQPDRCKIPFFHANFFILRFVSLRNLFSDNLRPERVAVPK